jgi:hypothetical protein
MDRLVAARIPPPSTGNLPCRGPREKGHRDRIAFLDRGIE